MSQSKMREISMVEVEQVSGGGTFGVIGAALGGAAAIAGGLALVPTPASPALGAFAVVSGVLGATFAAVDAMSSDSSTLSCSP